MRKVECPLVDLQVAVLLHVQLFARLRPRASQPIHDCVRHQDRQ